MKQRWKNKEYAKKMSEQSIKLWQNNDHIEKMNKIHTSDEWRTKQRLNQYNYLEKTGWREPCDEIRRCKKCGNYFIIMMKITERERQELKKNGGLTIIIKVK